MNIDLLPEEDLLIKHRFGEPGFYMRPEKQAANPHFHYQSELLFCTGGTAKLYHDPGYDSLHQQPGKSFYLFPQ